MAGRNAPRERVTPMLLEWQRRWERQVRENDRLRASIGQLLGKLSRLTDRG